MAPPFDQFFIEFQRVPNAAGLHAWGAHFKAISDPTRIAELRRYDNGYPRWVYEIETYLEKRKGKPYQPDDEVALCSICLEGDGNDKNRHFAFD